MPKPGAATGLAYSEQYDNLMELIGNTPLEYSQNPSFVSGAVSGGATYEGQFSDSNTLSGNWTNNYDGSSGTYSGSRIGGAIDAAYRFTGQFSGDGYGLLAFDMDDANNITGIAYSIDGDELINLTGSLSGTSLTVRSSDGTTATGTLNTSTGEMNGTWSDVDGGLRHLSRMRLQIELTILQLQKPGGNVPFPPSPSPHLHYENRFRGQPRFHQQYHPRPTPVF